MTGLQTACLSAMLFALGGCAVIGQNECGRTDWQAAGYADGSTGQPVEAFRARREACIKSNAAPEFLAYELGRKQGLEEYCQPRRGFDEGRLGAKYADVCPTSLEEQFLKSYADGRSLYRLEINVDSTQRQLDHHSARIKEIDRALASIAGSLLIDAASGDERGDLVDDSKQLAGERLTLVRETEELKSTLVAQQEELATHEQELVTQDTNHAQ